MSTPIEGNGMGKVLDFPGASSEPGDAPDGEASEASDPSDGVPYPDTEVSEIEMEKFKKMAERFQISVEDISVSLWRRLEFLDRKTKTCKDEQQAIGYAEEIFAYLERSPHPLSHEDLHQIKLATVLTDIGKTGPLHANKEEQTAVIEAITDIFAIDKKFDVENKTLAQYLEEFIVDKEGNPDEKRRAEITDILEGKMQIPTNMKFRQFINLHAGWTYDLLKYGGASGEVLVDAANHHMLEGVNPHGIYDEDVGEIQYGTIRRPFDRREVFVILLDKYDANRRRGGATHEEAVAYLKSVIENKDRIDKNGKEIKASPIINRIFGKQPIIKQLFFDCIGDLDAALRVREFGAVVGIRS